jgi:hypothetical protein
MKTIAELKRRIVAGTRVTLVTAGADTIVHGNGGSSVLPSKLAAGTVRTVAIVQARGVTLRGEGGTSFIEYPRASEVEFLDADTFRITWAPGNAMTYRIVEDAA